MPLKVMTIFGTRPEAVKMAPLVKELESRAEIQSICCITAQHRQMLDDVLSCLPSNGLRSDIMEARQRAAHHHQSAFWEWRRSFPGKSRTWFWSMGTRPPPFPGRWQCLFYQKIAVGHVEAGLRTWDKYSLSPRR